MKAHADCTTCASYKLLLYFNDDGVADVEHICTYLMKPLTAEEIKEACDAYMERWDE